MLATAIMESDTKSASGWSMSSLLGERVVDRLSGQMCEVVGYSSSDLTYRVVVVAPDVEPTADDAQLHAKLVRSFGSRGALYEPGHSFWRRAEELLVLA